MRAILLFIFLSVAVKAAPDGGSPSELKVRKLVADSITSDLSIIGSDGDTVLPLLRDIATGKINHIGGASVSQDNAQIVLMRLGDDQTIQQVVAQYQQYNSSYVVGHIPDMLEWSHQPAAISYLASDFYLDEDAAQSINLKENWEVVGVPARSIYSGVIALEIIKRDPDFSSEMKAWAREAYALRLKDPAKFRRLMQAWWNKNKDAFSQRNYTAVQPIDISSLTSSASAPSQSPPQEKPVSKPPEPVAQVAPPPQTPKPIAEMTPASDTGIPFWLYGVIAFSIAVIISAGYYLRGRK